MLFLICFLAFRHALKGETFEFYEGMLIVLMSTLLWMLAAAELVGELYGIAVLAYYPYCG